MFSKETVQYEYRFPVTNEGMETINYIMVNVIFTINDINIIIIVDVIVIVIVVIIIITVVVAFATVVL